MTVATDRSRPAPGSRSFFTLTPSLAAPLRS